MGKGNKLHDSSIHFGSFQHWDTQWKNLKDIPCVCTFVMITRKSSTNPTNELYSNASELNCLGMWTRLSNKDQHIIQRSGEKKIDA